MYIFKDSELLLRLAVAFLNGMVIYRLRGGLLPAKGTFNRRMIWAIFFTFCVMNEIPYLGWAVNIPVALACLIGSYLALIETGHSDYQDVGTRKPGYAADGEVNEEVAQFLPAKSTVKVDVIGMAIVGVARSLTPSIILTALIIPVFFLRLVDNLGANCLLAINSLLTIFTITGILQGVCYYLGRQLRHKTATQLTEFGELFWGGCQIASLVYLLSSMVGLHFYIALLEVLNG